MLLVVEVALLRARRSGLIPRVPRSTGFTERVLLDERSRRPNHVKRAAEQDAHAEVISTKSVVTSFPPRRSRRDEHFAPEFVIFS